MRQAALRAGLICALVCCCISFARAEQDVPQQKPDVTLPESEGVNATEPPVSDPGADVVSTTPPIRAMNGAGPLRPGRVSPLQFGSIYLQSADFLQSADAVVATGQPNVAWRSLSVLRANIVLDRAFKRSHFAAQYQPRLSVVDGSARTDTANLSVGWNSVFPVSPVLEVVFSDGFSYYGQQSQFDNLNLMADLTTGSLVQSHFLEGNGHLLNNRVEAGMRYHLGPRSQLEATGFFDFYSASGTQVVNRSESPGGRLTYGYLISPTKSLGLTYEARDTHFSKLLPTTLYQTVTASYSQRLSMTWSFSVSGGAATASSSVLANSAYKSRQVTATAAASVTKKFRESLLAFEYYRGQSTGMQITNGFADRYDLAYSHQLSRRVGVGLGGGYYREFLSATNTAGAYASAGVSYRLASAWSLQCQYAYKHQTNGGALFASGELHYLAFGIRWEPRSALPGF
jgi:hypothetical protein